MWIKRLWTELMLGRYGRGVRAAALWLDKDNPSWFDKVDTTRLVMLSGSDCILGQAYGRWGFCNNYQRICDTLGNDYIPGTFSSSYVKPYWVKEIEARRKQDATQVVT